DRLGPLLFLDVIEGRFDLLAGQPVGRQGKRLAESHGDLVTPPHLIQRLLGAGGWTSRRETQAEQADQKDSGEAGPRAHDASSRTGHLSGERRGEKNLRPRSV